jgi:hypothetical protein
MPVIYAPNDIHSECEKSDGTLSQGTKQGSIAFTQTTLSVETSADVLAAIEELATMVKNRKVGMEALESIVSRLSIPGLSTADDRARD